MKAPKFRFRNTDRIGAAGAEEDREFLSECFVDTGVLKLVEEGGDHRQILLGRTGSGKSALLAKLAEDKKRRVIAISPDSLSLTYVSHSTIIRFFDDLGVNLDPFFKLLWKHVFTVEVLRRHFEAVDPEVTSTLFDRLAALFSSKTRKDRKMREAIEYLRNWGEKFWLETEYRVKEITERLESGLSNAVHAQTGVPFAQFGTSTGTFEGMSKESKAELQSRGQQVVSKAQVQDLQSVMELLDQVLDDPQKQYYVVIDGLDQNWVEERLRYKLIMALIDTARDFIRVRHAKIVVALRRDLIERVFRLTRESGFQEEKYESLYIPLTWSEQHLIEVLDRRIDKLVSHRYTKERVTHRDLLPKRFHNRDITEYIVERARRPRDIIALFNCCISAGTDLERLGSREFESAEREYSNRRFRALGDEWSAEYPYLLDFARILQRRAASFKVSTIERTSIEDLCLEAVGSRPEADGALQNFALQVVNCVLSPDLFRTILIHIFYRVGLVGLKVKAYEGESWVDSLGHGVPRSEITSDSSVVVHPCYRRALGIT